MTYGELHKYLKAYNKKAAAEGGGRLRICFPSTRVK